MMGLRPANLWSAFKERRPARAGRRFIFLSYFQQIHLTLVKLRLRVFQIEMELSLLGGRKLEHAIRKNAFADAGPKPRDQRRTRMPQANI